MLVSLCSALPHRRRIPGMPHIVIFSPFKEEQLARQWHSIQIETVHERLSTPRRSLLRDKTTSRHSEKEPQVSKCADFSRVDEIRHVERVSVTDHGAARVVTLDPNKT